MALVQASLALVQASQALAQASLVQPPPPLPPSSQPPALASAFLKAFLTEPTSRPRRMVPASVLPALPKAPAWGLQSLDGSGPPSAWKFPL